MVFQHSTGSCRWQFVYPLLPAARTNRHFNPGQGWVSHLCHEPRVALAVIEELLAPYRANQQLRVLLRHYPIAAEQDGDRICAVTLADAATSDQVVVYAAYVLDATELGDLLELADIEHVAGAESQLQTGEMCDIISRYLSSRGWCVIA